MVNGIPSSSSRTLVERVGLRPRTPMLGRRPSPSSSRTTSPGTLRSASLVVKTRLALSCLASMRSTEPGMRARRSGVPTTDTPGSCTVSRSLRPRVSWATTDSGNDNSSAEANIEPCMARGRSQKG
jgi:hypothetical protein